MKQYLPLLNAKAQQQAIYEKPCQVIYDRILIDEGESQLYGTHQKMNGYILLDLGENESTFKKEELLLISTDPNGNRPYSSAWLVA